MKLLKWTLTIAFLMVNLAMVPLDNLDLHYRLLEQMRTDFMDGVGTTFFVPMLVMWIWEAYRTPD